MVGEMLSEILESDRSKGKIRNGDVHTFTSKRIARSKRSNTNSIAIGDRFELTLYVVWACTFGVPSHPMGHCSASFAKAADLLGHDRKCIIHARFFVRESCKKYVKIRNRCMRREKALRRPPWPLPRR